MRQAQELGFSLNEIRDLLILRAGDIPSCSHVKELLDQKLIAVQQKMRELRKLVRTLKTAQRKCQRELKSGGRGHGECCPVLEEISRAASTEEQE